MRKAFDTPEDPYLPPHILYRQKEQFSDGVGYSWIDQLREKAEHEVRLLLRWCCFLVLLFLVLVLLLLGGGHGVVVGVGVGAGCCWAVVMLLGSAVVLFLVVDFSSFCNLCFLYCWCWCLASADDVSIDSGRTL